MLNFRMQFFSQDIRIEFILWKFGRSTFDYSSPVGNKLSEFLNRNII